MTTAKHPKTALAAERTDAENLPESPLVTPEEQHALAASCAFFKAEHYREAEPGEVRSSDIDAAEKMIRDAVEQCACGKKHE